MPKKQKLEKEIEELLPEEVDEASEKVLDQPDDMQDYLPEQFIFLYWL